MKIGIIVEWLDTTRGGAETSTRQFIDGLLERDIELEIVTRSQLPAQNRVTVHTSDTPNPGRRAKTAQFLNAAENWVRQSDCDLTHAFVPIRGADIYQPRGGTVPETILRTAAARDTAMGRLVKRCTLAFNGRQRLVHAHERDWLTGANPPFVIALSNYVTRQLKTHYQLPDTRIRRIFNGVNPPNLNAADRATVRSRCNIPQDAVMALQVCHNFRLKGVHILLDALATLRDSNLHVVIAGDGNTHYWTQRAKRAGLDSNVHFIGPTDNVAALYAAADFLVHPTFYDPCSRVVLESIAAQLPAIATRHDGSSEILQHNHNACILNDPTPTALADALATLSTPATRHQYRQNLAILRGEVSMQKHVDGVIALYRELV